MKFTVVFPGSDCVHTERSRHSVNILWMCFKILVSTPFPVHICLSFLRYFENQKKKSLQK